jgi:bifunctional UDP-N-acetylglucosamine pyrophosphorylase/glucosamine-1-phosphate N-acetyltransferase
MAFCDKIATISNMKIVILAAGRGIRMNTLTLEKPKPMLLYKDKNLLEHKLEILSDSIEEIIFVIGYLGEQIREYFGDFYKNIPIRYVEQKEMKGTAHALLECKDFLNGPFIVLMGDDLYDAQDIRTLIDLPKNSWALLTYPDAPGIKAGKIVKDMDGNFKEIYEDFDGTSQYNLIYTGACLLTPDIFSKEMAQLSNGEFGLPQTISKFVNEKDVKILETNTWIRITSPEDLK